MVTRMVHHVLLLFYCYSMYSNFSQWSIFRTDALSHSLCDTHFVMCGIKITKYVIFFGNVRKTSSLFSNPRHAHSSFMFVCVEHLISKFAWRRKKICLHHNDIFRLHVAS